MRRLILLEPLTRIQLVNKPAGFIDGTGTLPERLAVRDEHVHGLIDGLGGLGTREPESARAWWLYRGERPGPTQSAVS